MSRRRKLTDEQEDSVLWYYRSTDMSMDKLGVRFGVSQMTINNAIVRAAKRAQIVDEVRVTLRPGVEHRHRRPHFVVLHHDHGFRPRLKLLA